MKSRLTKEQITRAILSLVFAFFLWLVANTNTNPISTPKYSGIKVEYTNLAENLIVENEISTVDIKLYGTASLMREINKENIRAVIDLSQLTSPGEYTLEVVILGLPTGITVTDISQKYVKVKLVNLVSAETNYTIETTGAPASGHIVLFVDKPSQNVNVSGSESVSGQISHIMGKVDISGISSDYSTEVQLYAYDAKNNIINDVVLSPAKVNVTVIIGDTKTVPVNVVTTGQCAANHSLNGITLNHPTVIISGKAGVLASISQIDTAPIDISGAAASYNTAVSLNLPSGISLAQNYDLSARVEIEGDATKTFTYDTLQIRNLQQKHKISFSDTVSFTVTVTGPKDVVNSITKESITAYIDLAELSEGAHTVAILYELPAGASISSSSMQTVNIILSAE